MTVHRLYIVEWTEDHITFEDGIGQSITMPVDGDIHRAMTRVEMAKRGMFTLPAHLVLSYSPGDKRVKPISKSKVVEPWRGKNSLDLPGRVW